MGEEIIIADQEMLLEGVEATRALARRLAAGLIAGDLLLLRGPLGAGKTTLVRGLVEALGGSAAAVASPTFTLVHQYPTATGSVIHVDAYRLTSEADLDGIGALELDDDAIICIEWADRIPGLWDRPGVCRLDLDHAGGEHRHACVHLPAERVLPA